MGIDGFTRQGRELGPREYLFDALVEAPIW